MYLMFKMNTVLSVAFIKLCVMLLMTLSAAVNGQQKTYSHNDFPPLYKFDDYDTCLEQKHDNLPSTFCMVYAEIKGNNSSQLWHRMMQHYEEFPFRYRHDHIFFGVCIKRCENSINRGLITDDDILKNEVTDYFTKVHKRPLDEEFRRKYHNLIHNCISNEFRQKYDLNLRTFIEYCEGPKGLTEEANKDAWENLLYKIIGVIAILNILSTLYDYCLKLQQPEESQSNDFYKINPQGTVCRLLTSFSICRNYYRVTQPYFSDSTKEFTFLDGFRTVCIMLALYGHVYFSQFQHIANPKYYEKNATDSLWILNTSVIIEICFVMSGLLLFIKFQENRFVTLYTSWKQFIITYIKLMVFRYIRFLPSVALLILFNAAVLTHLQNGPFWRHITEPVKIFSRERGWRNLLMINNFSHKESASHHTWYLAADWQLFALYLFVIMIVSKYPQYKKRIYSGLGIMSFVIPFTISYLFKLSPSFIIKPESYRYSFFKDIDVYYKIYMPFYTNLLGYLFGIICGEIYLKYTRTDTIRKRIRNQPLYTIATIFLVFLTSSIFLLGIKLDVQGPSLWSALYAGLNRNIWIIVVCGCPLLLMTCGSGWMTLEFCCLPIFRVLARLSFQVYIWHMTFIYLLNGYHRQPYYLNDFYFFTQFVVLYCLSNVWAFIIALFIEYPIAQSLQVLQSRKSGHNVKKSS